MTNKRLLWMGLFMFLLCMPIIWFWKGVSRYDHTSPDPVVREAAIVLGAATWNEDPSPALQERLDMAYTLFKDGLVNILILSGGSAHKTITEAEAMKRYLLRKGIPENHLILENRSTTTQENVKCTSGILKHHKLSDVYLVTHDYHMYRALQLAKQAHIAASPAPIHSKVLFMPFHKTRESYALLKMTLSSLYKH